MSFLDKARTMFLRSRHIIDERPETDPVKASLTVAIQRNERASRNARAALEECLGDRSGMADTVKGIVGKMQ